MRERRLVREEHLMAHGRQIADQNLGAFLAWVVGNADLDSQTQRENGVARLDGTRPCATVARKVWSQGTRQRPFWYADTHASEARRPEAGSRAVGARKTQETARRRKHA